MEYTMFFYQKKRNGFSGANLNR